MVLPPLLQTCLYICVAPGKLPDQLSVLLRQRLALRTGRTLPLCYQPPQFCENRIPLLACAFLILLSPVLTPFRHLLRRCRTVRLTGEFRHLLLLFWG